MKEKYKKNQNLYQNIISAIEAENDEKWINLLCQTNDENFIVQNIEYYLAKYPFRKSIWKQYIKFWEIKNYEVSEEFLSEK